MIERAEFSAVIFDMDGLVLDTEKTYRAAWREAGTVLKHHFPESFLETLAGLAGDAVLRSIENFCGPGFDADEFTRVTTACWLEFVAAHGIEVKRGFHELIGVLDREGIPFCLATNSVLSNAARCLELAGLGEVFPMITARDHVPRGKPAPDIFLHAAAKLAVPIQRCVVLEDSPVGIEAAYAAGALPVMVPSLSAVDAVTLGRCRFVLNDLSELAGMIRY